MVGGSGLEILYNSFYSVACCTLRFRTVPMRTAGRSFHFARHHQVIEVMQAPLKARCRRRSRHIAARRQGPYLGYFSKHGPGLAAAANRQPLSNRMNIYFAPFIVFRTAVSSRNSTTCVARGETTRKMDYRPQTTRRFKGAKISSYGRSSARNLCVRRRLVRSEYRVTAIGV